MSEHVNGLKYLHYYLFAQKKLIILYVCISLGSWVHTAAVKKTYRFTNAWTSEAKDEARR
jgi:hypothetical protein